MPSLGRRRALRRLAFSLIVPILITTGCSPTKAPPPTRVVFFLFDPTVLEPAGRPQFISLLNRLRSFLLTIPPGTRLLILSISLGVTQASYIYDKTFEPQRGVDYTSDHIAAVDTELRTRILRLLNDEWEAAHQAPRVTQRTSCLLSALTKIDRRVEHWAKKKDFRFYAVILSDMLESCDEWGAAIDLEPGRPRLDSADLARIKSQLRLTLSSFHRVAIVQVKHRNYTTPNDVGDLERFWRALLQQFGLKQELLYYEIDFPDTSFWRD